MRGGDAFEPHFGRIHARGGGRARRYLARVLAATNLARGSGRTTRGHVVGDGGRGGAGRVSSARVHGARSTRRVMIKARIVRLAGKGTANAIAHLRYIERDGTTREGQRGQLYGPESDSADGREFLARGIRDRHQFRFIVSAEDGAEYEDLKPLTRRLMRQAEIDLGTRLDWVAVDHFNTGHPHMHIMLRGVDEAGCDLVIPRDYLAAGLRARAAELVELDLGPASPLQERARARRDIAAERVTRLDRKFAAEADNDGIVVAHTKASVDQALRSGRLSKLERLGLARSIGAGRWRVEPDFIGTLQRLGERGDVIRTMQRAFARTGEARAIADQMNYDPDAPGARPLVGRVLERGLADEHRDHDYLIVDGVDGRTHYVRVGKGAIDDTEELFGPARGVAGATVRITPRAAGARKADRIIASVAAANDGRYDREAHRRYEPSASQSFVEAHVRRLEAVCRATRAVERDSNGGWSIPDDYLARVEKMEAARLGDRPVEVTILSRQPPKELSQVDGLAWIDHEIVATTPTPLRASGFGQEVREAIEARRGWLAAEGLLGDAGERDAGDKLIRRLRSRDLSSAAASLSRELGLPYTPIEEGRIIGTYRHPIELASGRFAVIERAHDFTLVPWSAELERVRGRSIKAEVKGERTIWSLGRSKAGPGRSDL